MAHRRAARPARGADALPASVGRGRLLPRERVVGERWDAPVLGFLSPADAAARMDCGMLYQIVRRKPCVVRNPERGGDIRRQHPDLPAGWQGRGPPRRHRRIDSIRIQLARLSPPRLRAREFHRAADYRRRDRRARRYDGGDWPGRDSRGHFLRRMRNQVDGGDSVCRDAGIHRRRTPPNRGRSRFGRHLRARARRVQRDPLPALRRRVHLPDVRVSFYEGARPLAAISRFSHG